MTGIKHIINYNCVRFESAVRACIPKEPVVSLIQDESSTTKPTVEPGNIVKEGQLLVVGRTMSAGVHSPVPGTVKCITNASMPNGKKALAVQIKFQGEFSFIGKKLNPIEWKAISSSQLCRLFAEKGIVNTFGKPMSLASQISEAFNKRMSILIVRLFDEEPGYDTDGFIARNYISKLITGSAIIAKALNANGVIFAYSKTNGKPDFSPTELELFGSSQVEFIPIDTDCYPYGGIYQLIETITKTTTQNIFKEICTSDLFVDSSTILDVYEAIVFGIPVFDRLIHVSGSVLKKEGMFKVRIGTPIRDLVSECGGFTKKCDKIVINGLIHGCAAVNLDTPITKYVKAIRFMSPTEVPDQKESLCVRCGRCHSVCPLRLHPERIYAEYIRDGKISSEQNLALDLCTGCSVCNTVCPSRLPISQVISMLHKESKNTEGGFNFA